MSEIREFKTESKRLLDLMINSIYTNQEIFLRELISNASDAIDKYHYLSLTNESIPTKNDYEINIEIDKISRTLKITDNGIGMTYDELNTNLGTIAKSGSLEVINKLEEQKDDNNTKNVDIIGQFGVGFYSAFMVSKLVEVRTKSPLSDKGYLFKSVGSDTYEVEEIEKNIDGTEIILYLRNNVKNDEENVENYDQYLDEYVIRRLVKKYSDYIRYPITMYVTRKSPLLDNDGNPVEGEYTEYKELETLNSMIPLWKKNKKDVTEEEYNEFYQQKFNDYSNPLTHLIFNIEGNINYTALLYIPSHVPYDLYTTNYEKGLQLYTKGVFIMDKCKELLPDYLKFVKGLVDSADLSLNISREMLQQNRILQMMSKNIEKKIISKLENYLEDDFEKYVEFFKNFGVNLKFGAYENFGTRKEQLKDLLIYQTVNSDSYITLKTYVEKMLEDQKYIYYVSTKDKESVAAMPQMDLFKKKGYDVILLNEDIDEFLFKVLGKYNDIELKSINQGDLNELISEEEQQQIESLENEKQSILDSLKKALTGKVKDVVFSKRLTSSDVCLVSGDGISFEMEKVLKQLPDNEEVSADKILEINPNHELFKAIEKVHTTNPELIDLYANLLYEKSLLIEGFKLENPIKFANQMCELMIKASEK